MTWPQIRRSSSASTFPTTRPWTSALRAKPDIALRTCQREAADGRIWADLAEAHVYLISSAKDELPRQWFATADLLARCPKLLCVSSSGAGYDTVDVDACTKAGVIVVNQAGMNAARRRAHARHDPVAVEAHRRKRPPHAARTRLCARGGDGPRDRGKVLGIVGIGHIGTRVARAGEGLRHGPCSPTIPTSPRMRSSGAARGRSALDDLLAQSDFVSLHCPRNAETLGMIDARAFGRMKKGAISSPRRAAASTTRPRCSQALESGHLAGAGVDVWDREPPPLDHPLLALDNVIATYPHRRRDPRSAPQHGRAGGRTDRRLAQGRPAAAARQSRGMAGLSRAFRGDLGLSSAAPDVLHRL